MSIYATYHAGNGRGNRIVYINQIDRRRLLIVASLNGVIKRMY